MSSIKPPPSGPSVHTPSTEPHSSPTAPPKTNTRPGQPLSSSVPLDAMDNVTERPPSEAPKPSSTQSGIEQAKQKRSEPGPSPRPTHGPPALNTTDQASLEQARSVLSDTYGPFDLGAGESSFQAFYDKYADQLEYKMIQFNYVGGRPGPEHAGVCRAASTHWLGRALVKGKPSFTSSKKSDDPVPSGPKMGWTERMARKFEKTFVPGQATTFQQNLKDAGLEAMKPQNFVTITGDFDKRGNLITIDSKAFVTELSEKVEPGAAYMLGTIVAGVDGETTGHAIALNVEGDEQSGVERVRIMDPNLGEFKFDAPDEEGALLQFLADWWSTYRADSPTYVQLIEVKPAGT